MSPCSRGRAACRWSSGSTSNVQKLAGTLAGRWRAGLRHCAPGATTLVEVQRQNRRPRAGRDRGEDRLGRASHHAGRDAGRVMINVAEPIRSRKAWILLAATESAWCAPNSCFSEWCACPTRRRHIAPIPRLVEWAAGSPVTIRTLDAGGDKPIPGYTVAGETNPFLGMRGVRLSLRHPDVFRVQLRALARAAALGHLKIMLPMVTTAGELAAARKILQEVVEASGPSTYRQPAAARHHGRGAGRGHRTSMHFDAAFFSIGINDLTQYVTAAARDSGVRRALAN